MNVEPLAIDPEIARSGVLPEGKSLSDHYTLWEVEKWEDRDPVHVNRDPYLLKPLGGPFYAVVGEWELTDLERSLQQYMQRRGRG